MIIYIMLTKGTSRINPMLRMILSYVFTNMYITIELRFILQNKFILISIIFLKNLILY